MITAEPQDVRAGPSHGRYQPSCLRCILNDKVCIMKKRITLTIDPAVARRARKVARAKKTSVSGMVQELLRSVPISGGEKRGSFVDRWAGKFTVAESLPGDRRMAVLKTKYDLASR